MDYVEFCTNLSHKAAEIMLKYFLQNNMQTQNKSDQTLVTLADTTINKLVIDEVKKHYPEHGVLGEEENYNINSKYLWVVDPIDGTSMFAAGIPTNVFAIALCIDANPLISCVYSPYTKQLWISENGKATCNGLEIRCSNKEFSKEKRLLIGICSEKSAKYNLHKVSEYLCDNLNANIVNLRSTIYMDMLVASGKLAANIAYSNHGHDCIGSHIVEKAGGQTTSIYGDKITLTSQNNGYISSNGAIHAQLLEILRKFRS
jgi:myo-inositol-1(or 4)-monophosphatase